MANKSYTSSKLTPFFFILFQMEWMLFGRPCISNSKSSGINFSFKGRINSLMYLVLSRFVSANFLAISLYVSGSMYFMDKSSNSVFKLYKPIRWAKGAYTQIVSEAIFNCFSCFIESRVRILCKRSASFINITLGSSVRVNKIFLKFSACWLLLASMTPEIFVNPSTIFAISFPNSFLTSSKVKSVSSMVSCNNAQMVLRTPNPISSTQIMATAIGCNI